MARPQLTALLNPRGNEDEPAKLGIAPPAAEPTEPAPAAAAEPAEVAPGRNERTGRRTRTPKAPKPATEQDLPPYLRFERKEARLRTDQLTGLTLRARQLNKTKDPDSDRITDNTLIRIAVDLLLARADDLAGGDEAALRKSLGL